MMSSPRITFLPAAVPVVPRWLRVARAGMRVAAALLALAVALVVASVVTRLHERPASMEASK